MRAHVRRTPPPHCTNAHLHGSVRSTPHALHSTPCRLSHAHTHTHTHTHTHQQNPSCCFVCFSSTVHPQILPPVKRRPSSFHQSSPSLPPSLGSLLCQSPCSSQSCSTSQIWLWLLALAHFIWHTNLSHRLYSD